MLARVEAENIIRSLTGGTFPPDRGVPVFNRDAGWVFETIGSVLPFLSAKDEGVITDGVTDVTADLQSLATSLTGGGILYCGFGTYYFSQLQIPNNVTIMGSGFGTVFKQVANSHTVDDTGTSTGSNTTSTLNDTGKTWTLNEHKYKTVRIVSGTGAGQIRMIIGNSATQLGVGTETGVGATAGYWTVVPDATSVYEILDPTDMLVLSNVNDEGVTVCDLFIDGNKANQLAFNSGIHFNNLGGTFLTNDSHHRVQGVRIYQMNGSGLTIGFNVREMSVIRVAADECGRHGFMTFPVGGTDNTFVSCTAGNNGWNGFFANGTNNRYLGCKGFGSGQDTGAVDNGNGFLLVDFGESQVIGCDAQENGDHGFYLYEADNNMLVVRAMSNDLDGVRLWDSSHNTIIVNAVGDESLPSGFVQDYAVGFGSGPNVGNTIIVNKDSTHVQTSPVHPSLEADDNIIISDGRVKHKLFNAWGTKGSSINEHFTFGKATSPASADPYYTLKTDDAATPQGLLEGYDGTTVKRFLAFNYGSGHMELGAFSPAVLPRFTTDDNTGSGTASLGSANCPATTLSAPYTWIKVEAPDGSTVWIPVWK